LHQRLHRQALFPGGVEEAGAGEVERLQVGRDDVIAIELLGAETQQRRVAHRRRVGAVLTCSAVIASSTASRGS
jgi:hypothetical protein